MSEIEWTTKRYPDPDWDRLGMLNDLLRDGLIEIRTVWCSELGIVDAGGHFHGADAYHVPDTFAVVTTPPLAERLLRKQVPITIRLPLREDGEDTATIDGERA